MKKKIIGVLLAAGSSRRMGENKLILPLENTNIGSLAFKQAVLSKLDHTLVVTKKKHDAKWIQSAGLKKEKWSVVECKEASQGQSFSLIAGVKEAEKRSADAVLILLGDQPFVSACMINQLIKSYNSSPAIFVAARFKGIPRPPVLFSSEFFSVLYELRGDRGAGSLLKQPPFLKKGIVIDFEIARPFLDIDTKEDYDQVMRRESSECADARFN